MERRFKQILSRAFMVLLMITSVAVLPLATSLRVYCDETSHITIYLDPATYTATNVDEIFEVEVKIANVSGLQGFSFRLGYDATKLDAVEVTEGSFLKGFGETYPVKLETDKTLGFVWIAIVILGETSAEGGGTLGTVCFKPACTGQNIFSLYETELVSSEGRDIDHYVTDGYHVDVFVDPPIDSGNLLTNGGFEGGLTGWAAGGWGNGQHTSLVVADGTHADALYYERTGSGADGGGTGVSQNLNILVSDYKDLYIELDVKVISNWLADSGYWSYYYGGAGEWPGHVVMTYEDANGVTYNWDFGFFPNDESEYWGRSNFQYVTRNEWYHFVSPNLADVMRTDTAPYNQPIPSPTPFRIISVYVGGGGWDYSGMFDNIKLSGTTNPVDIAVIGVTPSTTSVYRPNSLTISVDVQNFRDFTETFDVTVFYGNSPGDLPTIAQWHAFAHMGDVNRDGYITTTDVGIVAHNFGKTGPPEWIPSDVIVDGKVDMKDIGVTAKNNGKNIWSYFSLHGGILGTQSVINLPPGDSMTLVFAWNTAGYTPGDYYMGAYAMPVWAETNQADNKLEDGVITVICYKLTVDTDPPGLVPAPSIDPPSPDGFYDAGTLVTLTANPVSGYTFENWEVNPPIGPQAQPDQVVITMDQDYSVTAVYTFNLNIEAGFKAGDSPSFASDPYIDEILCVLTKALDGYKLAGTSPGTFDYALAIQNVGVTTFTSISLNIYGHNDFILQSENPIRVLDGSGSDITVLFEISGTWPTITISSKSTFTDLPASDSLYVTVHLGYALKGHIFSSSTFSKGYTFTATVSGTSGANQGSKDASGSVALLSKKVTIIFGFVTDSYGNPIAGAEVDLHLGTQLLYSVNTDADGFYCFVDSVDGVSLTGGVTYKVSIAVLPTYTRTVTAASQTAVSVNFKIRYCDL